MQDITIYQEVIFIELVQESGEHALIEVPASAEIDAAFLATWLHGKSEKTQTAYIADMRKFYNACGLPLSQVKLEDFQHFIDSLSSLKPTTRARAIATVKSVLSFGVKTGYLTFNVGAVVKLPKIENTLAERIMSEQQVAKMFALENNPRNHTILVLLYRAGIRAGELCNLTWLKLQAREQGGQVAVFGKGKKTRFVLLDEATWNEVMSLRTKTAMPDDYVFHSRQDKARNHAIDRGRLDESTVHKIVRTAADRAGVSLGKVSPHWMRHAHATHSLEHGAPITLVQDTLGHSSIETTAKYTHVRPNASSGQYLKV